MAPKIYDIKSEFHYLPERDLLMALYQPVEKTERSRIAVLQTHTGQYVTHFKPLVELARRGYTVAGVPQGSKSIGERMLDAKCAVEFMKNYPGIDKVVLFGHSQGGCIFSCYQYIAENGTERFRQKDRIIPFPELPKLPSADGLMLVDANYGIMSVLAMDPAIKSLRNGYERIPELDIYNPENGYDPSGSHYTQDFIRRFQKAQVKFYEDMLSYAQQRMEDMRRGRGMFDDDEVLVIPGAGGGSSSNKLFIQDNSLLSHTRNVMPLLHNGGTVTNEIVHTVRTTNDAPSSRLYTGAFTTTLKALLTDEFRFNNFGYDDCHMWGADWNFNFLSTQANVKGITVPLLAEGNTGSHEFINIEYTYENAASADKTVIFVEGSDHGFLPVKASEKFDGQFGDPAITFADYAAEWLGKEGRFL